LPETRCLPLGVPGSSFLTARHLAANHCRWEAEIKDQARTSLSDRSAGILANHSHPITVSGLTGTRARRRPAQRRRGAAQSRRSKAPIRIRALLVRLSTPGWWRRAKFRPALRSVFETWGTAQRAVISGQRAWFRTAAGRSRNSNHFSHYQVCGRDTVPAPLGDPRPEVGITTSQRLREAYCDSDTGKAPAIGIRNGSLFHPRLVPPIPSSGELEGCAIPVTQVRVRILLVGEPLPLRVPLEVAAGLVRDVGDQRGAR